jgi:hypothetical protein
MARREYPGVYPYPAAGGRTLYRTLYTDSNGVPRQKRGFTSPSAASCGSRARPSPSTSTPG